MNCKYFVCVPEECSYNFVVIDNIVCWGFCKLLLLSWTSPNSSLVPLLAALCLSLLLCLVLGPLFNYYFLILSFTLIFDKENGQKHIYPQKNPQRDVYNLIKVFVCTIRMWIIFDWFLTPNSSQFYLQDFIVNDLGKNLL